MIPWELFKKNINTIVMLTGRNMLDNEQRDLTYEKLKVCNEGDFNKACVDEEMIKEIGTAFQRNSLTYAVLIKYVSRYRSRRETEENRIQRHEDNKRKRGNPGDSEKFRKMMEAVKGFK